jgi:hypothetical protein
MGEPQTPFVATGFTVEKLLSYEVETSAKVSIAFLFNQNIA